MPPKVGWRALWLRFHSQTGKEEFTQPLWLMLILGPAIVYAAWSGKLDASALLHTIIDTVFSAFPSLTGLCLAGYTIVAGGLQPRLLYKMCRHRAPGRNSLMEDLNTTFALALLMAILTMALSFIFRITYSLPSPWLGPEATTRINALASCGLLYLVLVCFRSLLAIVINVFNFGQVLDHEFSHTPEPTPQPTPKKPQCLLGRMIGWLVR